MCLFPLGYRVLGGVLHVALIGNLWNRSPFLSQKKRAHCCTDSQEEVRYEGSPVKAPPTTRRRMTPRTPVQNSYTSFEKEQGSYEVEVRGWNTIERTIIARTRQYLERSESVTVRLKNWKVSWDQKTMAGKPGKKRCAAGEWAKRVV